MLVIRSDLVDAIVAHARADHPDEACGVLVAPEGSELPDRFVALHNAAGSPTFYEFGADYRQLIVAMDAADEWSVVIYHSHTATEAYPSRTDISYASGPLADPRVHYVLAAVHRDEAAPAGAELVLREFRSFRIVDGVVTEEDVEVVESYMFSHTGADDVPDRHRA